MPLWLSATLLVVKGTPSNNCDWFFRQLHLDGDSPAIHYKEDPQDRLDLAWTDVRSPVVGKSQSKARW